MAYRDYEKKTYDAWDIDDDDPSPSGHHYNHHRNNHGVHQINTDLMVNGGDMFAHFPAHTHTPATISLADADAVAKQIIKSHQEKQQLKSSSSLDSSTVSSPTSITSNPISPKGSGPGKALRQSISSSSNQAASSTAPTTRVISQAASVVPTSISSDQYDSWPRKGSEEIRNSGDVRQQQQSPPATINAVVKIDLESKSNTVVTSTATSNGGGGASSSRYGLAPTIGTSREKEDELARLEKFKRILSVNPIDLNALQKACWKGIPKVYRHVCWKLLSDYLPLNLELQEKTIEQKRQAYWEAVTIHYQNSFLDSHHDMLRQILNDIPRMNPLLPIFQNKIIQDIFQRVLYVWAVRHPGTGYVQGINDLLTPFFVVFLTEYTETEIQNLNIESLAETQRRNLEADCYWCMNKLLERIQENYVCSQPGIQKNIRRLEYLVKRIDTTLYNHLKKHNIEFIQFAFRWMNNLLMREIPLACTIRLWDTYHAEPFGFSDFHLYVCAAFLLRFSKNLCDEKDFQGLMMTLQNLPTKNMKASDIELLTAEAYQLQVMFADSPNHTSSI